MKCPICHGDTRVAETRLFSDGLHLLRRRKCLDNSCENSIKAFTTLELLYDTGKGELDTAGIGKSKDFYIELEQIIVIDNNDVTKRRIYNFSELFAELYTDCYPHLCYKTFKNIWLVLLKDAARLMAKYSSVTPDEILISKKDFDEMILKLLKHNCFQAALIYCVNKNLIQNESQLSNLLDSN